MTGTAVLIMLAAIIIIWGGLAVSVTALISRGRRACARGPVRRPPHGPASTCSIPSRSTDPLL